VEKKKGKGKGKGKISILKEPVHKEPGRFFMNRPG
jgi:hypothetical protein